MIEDVAATGWLAVQIGALDMILQKDVAKLHDRDTSIYGQ